jgi:hypothetical protein
MLHNAAVNKRRARPEMNFLNENTKRENMHWVILSIYLSIFSRKQYWKTQMRGIDFSQPQRKTGLLYLYNVSGT